MEKIYSFFVAILLCSTVSAHNFEAKNADGKTIYYTIIDEEAKEVAVAKNSNMPTEASYEGALNIPEKVTNGNASLPVEYSVTSIDRFAFSNCKYLTAIYIPKSITHVGKMVFKDCYDLNSIIVADDNPIFDSRNNCNAIIETESNILVAGCKSTSIPSTVLVIGPSAFTTCIKLTSITIPKGVTAIEKDAFLGCTGLKTIVLPSRLTSIGESAFYDCTNLASAVFGKDINKIGSLAFHNCGLQAVVCKSTIPPTLGTTVFSVTSIPLYVPTNCVATYQATSQWKSFSIYGQDFSGVDDVVTINNSEIQYFDIKGIMHKSLQNGVNIVTYSNGATKKVMK